MQPENIPLSFVDAQTSEIANDSESKLHGQYLPEEEAMIAHLNRLRSS